MATPIKLTLQRLDYKTDQPFSDPRYLTLDLSQKLLFEVLESDYIQATFSFDPAEYKIEYESYETGNLLEIESNSPFILSYGQEEKGSYYPGKFTLRITCNDTTTDYLFFVKPSRVQYQYVLNLRDYVNSFYNGLSKTILRAHIKNSITSNEGKTSSFSENIEFINEHMPSLLNYINQFYSARHTEASKEETISAVRGKISNISIQWLATKGMQQNKNILSPEKILISKTKQDINNQQNQIFKSELLFWNNELNQTLSSLQKSIVEIDNYLENYESELSAKVDHYQNIRDDNMISRSAKNSNFGRINELRKNIASFQKTKDMYSKSISNVQHYKTNIEYILFNSWLKNIDSIGNDRVKVTDKRLQLMLSLHAEYVGIKLNQKNGKKTYSFAEKCTPKLFETYIYIILINIFLDAGYSITNVDLEHDNLCLLLSNPSVIHMINGLKTIDIIYDHELNRSDDVNPDEDMYVYINSDHHRPDFIISYKENNILKKAIVVEAKWRPLTAIYNESDDTEVTRILRDYLMLGYHQKGHKRVRRSAIEKVVAVYPDLTEEETEISNDEILSVGIKPEKNIQITKGYQNLVKILLHLDEEDDDPSVM